MTAAAIDIEAHRISSLLGQFTVARSGAEVTLRCGSCGRPVYRARAIGLLALVAAAGQHLTSCKAEAST